MAQTVLEHGGDLEDTDSSGMRPIEYAIRKGDEETVKLFLRKGAKLGPTTWLTASHDIDMM